MLPGLDSILKFIRSNVKQVLAQHAGKDAPVEKMDCFV